MTMSIQSISAMESIERASPKDERDFCQVLNMSPEFFCSHMFSSGGVLEHVKSCASISAHKILVLLQHSALCARVCRALNPGLLTKRMLQAFCFKRQLYCCRTTYQCQAVGEFAAETQSDR